MYEMDSGGISTKRPDFWLVGDKCVVRSQFPLTIKIMSGSLVECGQLCRRQKLFLSANFVDLPNYVSKSLWQPGYQPKALVGRILERTT